MVDSELCDPAYSVAADEAMALARSGDEVPNTLHLYRRNRPTVSLGYFQKVSQAVDLDYCRKNSVAIVRRVTGGSAIYTDMNHLIYGLAVSPDSLPGDRVGSFRKVCSAIVAALGLLGIKAHYKPINDVLVGGRKISGSAQMRRWGIVLQHGTLIMENDASSMVGALRMDIGKVKERGLEPLTYTTSLAEALGMPPDPAKVKAALVASFEEEFKTYVVKSDFTRSEKERIKELAETKYGLDSWNLRF